MNASSAQFRTVSANVVCEAYQVVHEVVIFLFFKSTMVPVLFFHSPLVDDLPLVVVVEGLVVLVELVQELRGRVGLGKRPVNDGSCSCFCVEAVVGAVCVPAISS